MVDRRVEVDVVADRERHPHVDVGDIVQEVRALDAGQQLAGPLADLAPATGFHQRVERRLTGQFGCDACRAQVEHAVADADDDSRRGVAGIDEDDTERQVLEREVRALGDLHPLRHCWSTRGTSSSSWSACWL
jgi:hypothetical protein